MLPPQIFVPILFVVYALFRVGQEAARNGQVFEDSYNAWSSFLWHAAILGLIAWAGFFSLDKSLWPQIALLALFVMPLGMVVAKHGKPIHDDRGMVHSGWATFVAFLVEGAILWWGGLFAPLLHR